MRKILRILFLLILTGFVIIQFFQPEKNLGEHGSDDILAVHKVPADIAGILKESCYDCHSNVTRYNWYHKLAPVSWMINDHVVEGKDELNFSEWGNEDFYDKITSLEEISQETERKTMPLKSYLIMHRKAKLNEEQIEAIRQWATGLGEELLEEAAN